MGGSQSKHTHSQAFKQQDWQQIEWQPYTNIKDPTFSSNFIVYAHKNNPNLQLQKYQLFFNSQAQYISYLQIYYQRLNSIHIEQTSKKNMCSTFHSASIYLERIHFRLSELIQIPVEEGLYILDCALEGYERMFEKTGYFQVGADMIGVNKNGRVKVWVNKNFAKNFPDFNKIDLNKSEANFVLELIWVIQESLDYPKNQQTFKEYLLGKKIVPTFQSAKQALKQYQKMYKYIPQKSMKSIVLWVKKNSNKPIQSSNQILNHLKTSSFSVISQKNTQNFKQTQLQKNYNKKIQFSKLKNRVSNPRPLQTNKCYISYQPEMILNRQSHDLSIQQEREELETKRIVPVVNGVVHMSFIKGQRKQEPYEQKVIMDPPIIKISTKAMEKLPSISFSYKNSGLYSPQNVESKNNQWFSCKKNKKILETVGVGEKEKKKQFRKSLTTDISQDVISEKMRFYYSNGDTQEIDPDIARDLYTMTNIQP